MESQVDHLVSKAWEKYQSTPPNQRLLIAIGGIPGSGKTTLSGIITTRLNALAAAAAAAAAASTSSPSSSAPPVSAPAAFVPMDGYHLTRAQLSTLPNPAEAHARRGAVYTFNGEAFLALVRALRAPLTPRTPTIRAPSFDHAIKDPREDDIAVDPAHRIVVFEGNYVALDRPVWRDTAALMDELWFVDVDFDVARRRLVKRHVRAGIASDEADADRRARENDLVNGREIVDHRLDVHEVIVSREDGSWVHE
ncbi:hypothetical protein HYQ45_009978 [Verticillium longisporum]|uniref:Phosphoribulokinase/uridine kinase domain-containing protein n=1 Tax=Verticillium longisporum TaxID=100787 RepID=A0A0G4LT59_VERLO|nr:hypothetical protein HYQ44_003512 [Verticillium longisporum]KAG7131481.1 hypothetical protein HYQ45_009978 [Verticillium longisporum]CRK25256.1 hypothetical protein BN1723_013555 [Verticillium longisporum]CRK27052.1 hypothetical protein BN1708_004274 [Verticillium longisporum]